MGTKDCIYLVLAGLMSAFFYLRGYHCAEEKARARRKLDVTYNDSGCLTELPADDLEQVLRDLQSERETHAPKLTPAQIRATFGDN